MPVRTTQEVTQTVTKKVALQVTQESHIPWPPACQVTFDACKDHTGSHTENHKKKSHFKSHKKVTFHGPLHV